MKNLIGYFLLFLSINISFAQDAHFSQYNSSRLNTNPSFTGTDSTLNISTGGRLQWYNMDGGYKSFYFSADNYVRFMSAGIGVNYMYNSEINGAYTNFRIDLNYAPHFELFKHKLAVQPSFQMAYMQYTLDWSKLIFGDQIDERTGFVYNTRELPGRSQISIADFATGLLIYSTHYYGGIAVQHLTQPNIGYVGTSQLPIKITIHTGAIIGFKTKNFTLSPNILYMQQSTATMFLPGVTAKYKMVVAGVSYRANDAFIMNAGFQCRFLKIGYSYDYTTSLLTNKTTGGAHEVQLTWFMHYRKTPNKIKTLRLI